MPSSRFLQVFFAILLFAGHITSARVVRPRNKVKIKGKRNDVVCTTNAECIRKGLPILKPSRRSLYGRDAGETWTFSYTGAADTWTPPSDGYYFISLRGAQGGNGPSGSNQKGGKAALTNATFNLQGGFPINYKIGGHPNIGGGGGASMMYYNIDGGGIGMMMTAAGGGGAGKYDDGRDAYGVLQAPGDPGVKGGGADGGTGGQNGYGGQGGQNGDGSNGGGGASFYDSGANGLGDNSGLGGQNIPNNGAGGTSAVGDNGGFGGAGGAGGSSSMSAGGGGGGYSGGGGGAGDLGCGGGGGSSSIANVARTPSQNPQITVDGTGAGWLYIQQVS